MLLLLQPIVRIDFGLLALIGAARSLRGALLVSSSCAAPSSGHADSSPHGGPRGARNLVAAAVGRRGVPGERAVRQRRRLCRAERVARDLVAIRVLTASRARMRGRALMIGVDRGTRPTDRC